MKFVFCLSSQSRINKCSRTFALRLVILLSKVEQHADNPTGFLFLRYS